MTTTQERQNVRHRLQNYCDSNNKKPVQTDSNKRTTATTATTENTQTAEENHTARDRKTGNSRPTARDSARDSPLRQLLTTTDTSLRLSRTRATQAETNTTDTDETLQKAQKALLRVDISELKGFADINDIEKYMPHFVTWLRLLLDTLFERVTIDPEKDHFRAIYHKNERCIKIDGPMPVMTAILAGMSSATDVVIGGTGVSFKVLAKRASVKSGTNTERTFTWAVGKVNPNSVCRAEDVKKAIINKFGQAGLEVTKDVKEHRDKVTGNGKKTFHITYRERADFNPTKLHTLASFKADDIHETIIKCDFSREAREAYGVCRDCLKLTDRRHMVASERCTCTSGFVQRTFNSGSNQDRKRALEQAFA